MIDEHELDAMLGALADADAMESHERIQDAWNGVTAKRRRLVQRRQWVRGGMALAATLVIGFGLGRWNGRSGGSTTSSATSTVAAWSPMMTDLQTRSSGLLREVSATDATANKDWRPLAGELLWATRRLLDDQTHTSNADRQLLADLESVLTQVLDVHGTGNSTEDDSDFELRMVRQSIISAKLLDRLAKPPITGAS